MNMFYVQDKLNESKRNNVLNWILDTPRHSWEKHGFQCFSVVSPRILLALTIGLVYRLIKKGVHLCLLCVNKTPPCGLHPILLRLVPSDKVFYTVQFGYLKRWNFVFFLKYKKNLHFFLKQIICFPFAYCTFLGLATYQKITERSQIWILNNLHQGNETETLIKNSYVFIQYLTTVHANAMK